MREREAYPQLYQESAARQTADKSITILQGRCVGGGTTVNWTSSFRTPARTLNHWRDAHGLKRTAAADLEPWFARMEERLGIAPWAVAPNENNDVLRRGCAKLGYSHGVIARNVKGCANLGYCGMGCPTNAKQSMLVTTIPAALARGVTCVALGLLFGFQGFLGRDAFRMLTFGLRLGLDLGQLALFFFLLAALLGGDGGQALFFGALLGAFLARGGNGHALAGLGGKVRLGGFGAGLGLGQHFSARLGGGIQTVGEFFVV